MKIALLSDIHGNIQALDAVLADVEQQGGVNAYWILGDLVAIGPNPIEVLERLSQLPNTHFVRGNTDRYTLTGDRPPPSPDEALQNPSKLPILINVANSFAWTQGMITAAGWYDWLHNLPFEQRLILPDGTRLLGIHSSPQQDDGHGLHAQLTPTEWDTLLHNCQADLICAGHTHCPLDTVVNNIRIINLGSISNHRPPDIRASYVLLSANKDSYTITFRRVDYDRQATLTAVHTQHFPDPNYITSLLLGNNPHHCP